MTDTRRKAAPDAASVEAPLAQPLRGSAEDREAVAQAPQTAQTVSPTYRLAYTDEEFMLREELRPVRLQHGPVVLADIRHAAVAVRHQTWHGLLLRQC